jgi:hypothetical protein
MKSPDQATKRRSFTSGLPRTEEVRSAPVFRLAGYPVWVVCPTGQDPAMATIGLLSC